MLPLRSILNRAYRLMMAERDEKQRAELVDELWALEPEEQEKVRARVAEFTERADQMVGGGDGGTAG